MPPALPAAQHWHGNGTHSAPSAAEPTLPVTRPLWSGPRCEPRADKPGHPGVRSSNHLAGTAQVLLYKRRASIREGNRLTRVTGPGKASEAVVSVPP